MDILRSLERSHTRIESRFSGNLDDTLGYI